MAILQHQVIAKTGWKKCMRGQRNVAVSKDKGNIVIMEDFNTVVNTGCNGKVAGKYGFGKINGRAERILNFVMKTVWWCRTQFFFNTRKPKVHMETLKSKAQKFKSWTKVVTTYWAECNVRFEKKKHKTWNIKQKKQKIGSKTGISAGIKHTYK